MTSQITDNVVFLQFKRFLKENAEKETHKANKREAKEEDFEKEMQELFVQFLKEKYPGMRSSPHQMVAMMTSPDPEQTLNLHALHDWKLYKSDPWYKSVTYDPDHPSSNIAELKNFAFTNTEETGDP